MQNVVLRLEELTTIRVICQHPQCAESRQSVIEVPLGMVGRVTTCPVCQNDLQGTMSNNRHLAELAKAIEKAIAAKQTAIEFVVKKQAAVR
jgi:hypothetical protein